MSILNLIISLLYLIIIPSWGCRAINTHVTHTLVQLSTYIRLIDSEFRFIQLDIFLIVYIELEITSTPIKGTFHYFVIMKKSFPTF